MKLARFNNDRIGVVNGDRIIDVSDVCGIDPAQWPPVGINRLIATFAEFRTRLEEAHGRDGVPLTSVRLETPIPWPRNLLALPNNFADHSAEMSGRSYAVAGNLARRRRGILYESAEFARRPAG